MSCHLASSTPTRVTTPNDKPDVNSDRVGGWWGPIAGGWGPIVVRKGSTHGCGKAQPRGGVVTPKKIVFA